MATNETGRLTEPLPIWSRPVAIGAAALFFISWLFRVTAALSKNTNSFSKLWGRLDVGLAFVLVILTFAIMGIAQGKVDKQAEEASYRGYRILLHGILVCSWSARFASSGTIPITPSPALQVRSA